VDKVMGAIHICPTLLEEKKSAALEWKKRMN
jgi:hypothetical protein